MKHLLTLVALLISSLAMGQMPYNPDSNGDDLIGATDLISLLGLYNTILIDSTQTCDFEGTELEELCIGLADLTLELDSIYVEYHLRDTISFFAPGCPDIVLEPVELERSYMMTNTFTQISPSNGTVSVVASTDYLGFSRFLRIQYYPSSNTFYMRMNDSEVQIVTDFSEMSEWFDSPNGDKYVQLPFPVGWILNDDGIQVEWDEYDWLPNCEHFRLIPYWSEAE